MSYLTQIITKIFLNFGIKTPHVRGEKKDKSYDEPIDILAHKII